MSVSAALTVKELLARLGNPDFVLLMGLPASGKSTISQELEVAGFTRLNADAIREELYGDEAEQGDPKKVWGIFMSRYEAALQRGDRIVLDLTNMTRTGRKPMVKKAQTQGRRIRIILLDVPVEVCIERNSKRTRVVPEEVLRGMAAGFKRSGLPRADEGRLTIIRPDSVRGRFKIVKDETPLLLRR